MVTKLMFAAILVLTGGFLHVNAQRVATPDKGVWLNDPTVLKAAALLPEAYKVPVGAIKLVEVSKLPSQWQKIFFAPDGTQRAGLQLPGKAFVYINAESDLYRSANADPSSLDVFYLAEVIAHEYGYHGPGNVNGSRGDPNDEVGALTYEASLDKWFAQKSSPYQAACIRKSQAKDRHQAEIADDIQFAKEQTKKLAKNK